jgi:hypothetical protein
MHAAMRKAGVDRDFILAVWEANGSEQRLFVKGERYVREAHIQQVQLNLPAAVRDLSWGRFKALYD